MIKKNGIELNCADEVKSSKYNQAGALMYNPVFPGELERVFHHFTSEDELFRNLLPVLGGLLKCHRCFLYLRHPSSRYGRTVYCWRASSDYPLILDADWYKEKPNEWENKNPLFAAALNAKHSVFIEDIETADPQQIDRDFERQEFGHRSLVQGHILRKKQLWGILQACTFDRARPWMQFDRSIVIHTVQKLVPSVMNYVIEHAP